MVEGRDIVTRGLNLDGLGLEIGPGYNPRLPKSAGYRVETVDFTDAAALRERFRATPSVDIARIEEVDYVTGGRSILAAIGKQGRYDYIVASHVIEHFPDLLGFLKDCQTLLKPAGRLSLVVPDKRYCFDLFQTLTSTGQILQAHMDGAKRPTPGVLFDYIASNAKRDERIVWEDSDEADPAFVHGFATAKEFLERARASEEYIDAHVWHFVPSSFRLIISDLYSLGEIRLRELSFVDSKGTSEFYVMLSQEGNGPTLDRLSLAKQALTEQAKTSFY